MDTNDYIKMFNIKVDPDLPHHYIIGIAAKDAHSKTPGKLYLKYGPIYFTNEDVINIKHATELVKDKLFKTTIVEALESLDSKNHVVTTLAALRLSAQANMATLHHFSSKVPIEDEWFEVFVETAHLKSTKKLLDAARIHY